MLTRFAGLALVACAIAAAQPARGPITFNDDGGWCWFQDERALVYGGKLIIGSVAAGVHSPERRGNIEVVTCELATGRLHRFALHPNLYNDSRGHYDDHNAPAFVVRGDSRIVAVYAKHGTENRFYDRITEQPRDTTAWQAVQEFIPSEASRITYANVYRLAGEAGRIYNFFRGLDNSYKPSYAWSDDDGRTWRSGGVFINVPGQVRHRPYVKYASDGSGAIHFLYTEGHPRDYANSVYHVYYRAGKLHRSDGTVVRTLAEGLSAPDEGTCIFRGDPNNVAWASDIQVDSQGRPFAAYSVQKDSAGLPPGQGGHDHRYRYARWDGKRWVDHEIAYAGSRLYAGEDDYTGNVALDPDNSSAIYISTNADPATGKDLISRADHRRHYEVFEGRTAAGGATWTWTAVTRDSTADNLRPIMPSRENGRTALLWLRGTYSAYTDYDLDVVGLLK